MNSLFKSSLFSIIVALSLFVTASLFATEVSAQTRVEAESYVNVSGVSTESGWGDGGSVNIGSIDQGDWIEYLIHPNSAGTYMFNFRVGTAAAGAQFKIKKTDGSVLGTVDIPAGSDFQMMQHVAANIALPAGDISIRIESSAGTQWIFNYFEYSLPDGKQIEAENFSAQSGVLAETCMDAGSGLDVAYINQDDWMDYSVNLPSSGTYTAKFRIATKTAGQQIELRNSAGAVLATVNIPVTGDWQGWQTTQATLTLPGGSQTLRIYAITNGGWNINWWRLDPTNASPVANAGADQSTTSNAITLTGSGSDPDGSISAYAWSVVSGPSGSSFAAGSSASTTVNGLVAGTYIFRLTVTDNTGAAGTDDISVIVNASSTSNTTWSTGGNGGINPSLQFIGTTDAQPLIFKTNGHQQAMITSDGLLKARKIQVTQTGWADYVFDSTYRLKTLYEVEKFINDNKHLPDVPSAKQVTTEGINLGDNQAILLKKIEELTLYVIQLNKEVELLKQQNAAMKTTVAQKKLKN